MNFDIGSLFSKNNLPATLALGPAATLLQSNQSQSPTYNGMQYALTPEQAMQFGLDFSAQGTASDIALQNKVTPGSQAQRILAQKQLSSYIQGEVPLDVQQNTQRAIAQSLGGGYNPFTGGGQAPSAFARNIGQTSLGLSQYGLSAAPTWQQLANSMVVSPIAGAQIALGAGNQQMAGAENQYQAGFNQYAAQQAQQQQQANMLMGVGSLALSGYGAASHAGYLGGLSNYLGNLSGYANTSSSPFGGLPAATGYAAYNQPGGALYQEGTNVMVPAFNQ